MQQQNQNIGVLWISSPSSEVSHTKLIPSILQGHSDPTTQQRQNSMSIQSKNLQHQPPGLLTTHLILSRYPTQAFLPDFLVQVRILQHRHNDLQNPIYPQDLLLGETSASCGGRGLARRRYIVDLPKFRIRDYSATKIPFSYSEPWERLRGVDYLHFLCGWVDMELLLLGIRTMYYLLS